MRRLLPILAHAAPLAPATCPRRARRARHARRSLARSRTRASHRARAPSTCPCPYPCRGPCHRRAPHCQPPRQYAASSSVPASSFVSTSLHSSKQQADATLKGHVAIVCFKCFRYFRGMLQMLYINVAKVDRDVALVLTAIHVCF